MRLIIVQSIIQGQHIEGLESFVSPEAKTPEDSRARVSSTTIHRHHRTQHLHLDPSIHRQQKPLCINLLNRSAHTVKFDNCLYQFDFRACSNTNPEEK